MVVRQPSQHFYVQPILNDIFQDAQLLDLGSPERTLASGFTLRASG